jgi:hypothetical protein
MSRSTAGPHLHRLAIAPNRSAEYEASPSSIVPDEERLSRRSAQTCANFGNTAKVISHVGRYVAGKAPDGFGGCRPVRRAGSGGMTGQQRRRTEMISRNALEGRLFSAILGADRDICATRRGLLIAPLLAALPLAMSGATARAGRIDPAETAITLPDAIKWSAWSGGPPHSGEVATLYGGLDRAGPYLVLMRWNPGYMSAPHSYATDRLSLVLSGTWWVNSGAEFDPDNTVPVPAGGFVRRLARTPHYDGVKRDAKEPAVIALFGIAPVQLALVDPSGPAWRRV